MRRSMPRETAIFSGHLRRGFRYGAVYAALAKWPPNRAVSRVSKSWQSHVAHASAAQRSVGAPAITVRRMPIRMSALRQ
jgi:hypothetical protein